MLLSNAADDPALGAPVEYIDLRGTTREKPATCKYTGNKYYTDVSFFCADCVKPPGHSGHDKRQGFAWERIK